MKLGKRAARMRKQYVKVQKRADGYQVILTVYPQRLRVGTLWDKSQKTEAMWSANMLAKALARIK